jgi:serine/threonine-protein kinase
VGLPLRQLGRFELVARIGEGGMAEVFLARQRGPRQFEKLVVVKLVHPQVAARPEFATMLLDEARIAALVKHPNCVDIYDLGEDDGTYFIAMEYLEGESLAAILRASRDGRLDPFSTARIIAECATGLHYAHELRGLDGEPLELVHQDVTPANIVVLYTGQVKLVDFGVATVRSTAPIEQVRGKAAYLAPELLDGARANPRTDVFSLGVVLWEALTLRRLFWAQTEREIFARIRTLEVPAPSSLAPMVVRDLDDICLRALARDPAQRYQTAQAMRDDLVEILRHASWSGGDGPVARFMQTTFAPRIKARQALFRELAAQPTPRAATLEQLQAIHVDDARTPLPIMRRPESIEGVALVAPPPRRRRRWLELGLGATLLGGVALASTSLSGAARTIPVIATRGARAAVHAPSGPAPSTPVIVPAPSAPVIVPAPIAPAIVPAPTAPAVIAGAPIAPGPKPTAAPRPPRAEAPVPDRRPRPTPPVVATAAPSANVAVTAKSLYKEGLQDFVAGRTAPAIERFRKAAALDASFAPAYRGMGMAYERGGDRPSAARAYRKYLALAGRAADAAQIRARLAGLQ